MTCLQLQKSSFLLRQGYRTKCRRKKNYTKQQNRGILDIADKKQRKTVSGLIRTAESITKTRNPRNAKYNNQNYQEKMDFRADYILVNHISEP